MKMKFCVKGGSTEHPQKSASEDDQTEQMHIIWYISQVHISSRLAGISTFSYVSMKTYDVGTH